MNICVQIYLWNNVQIMQSVFLLILIACIKQITFMQKKRERKNSPACGFRRELANVLIYIFFQADYVCRNEWIIFEILEYYSLCM